MNYYTIQPPKDLADYVRFFWVLEGEATPFHPFVHRSLSDNCSELIFYYKGGFKKYSDKHKLEETFTAGVYGQSQQFYQFRTEGEFGIFGVYLYPYATPYFFSLPANELSNQTPDLKTLCGTEGEILEETLMLTADNSKRAKLVATFLMDRLKKSKNPYSGILSYIKHAIKSYELTAIPQLADNCNLSRRQFERKFKEFSGFSPKNFQRLARFNAAIKESSQRNKSLSQIAMYCGYYDQSHFIHDFNRFSGYNPKEFFAEIIEPINYRGASEFKL